MKYISIEMLSSFATKLATKIETIFAKKADIPTKLPANGGNSTTVNGHTVNADVPSGAKFTDTTYTHPNSGVTAGTYRSVAVNLQGHVTSGTNPTTLAGYGITDAAAKTHQHGNADITALDAGKITSGTIDIARLPAGALERCVVVADDTARLKLTKSTVQTGDTVKVTATGKMYFVVDDTKLTSEAGYEVYTAGTATSVPWSGVTGKPSTFAPSTHSHTKSQISDFPTSMPASDVPSWAKASSKPTYTPSEVGVIGTAPTNGQVAVFDGTTGKLKSTGYTILTSVPSGAKFTDTTYADMKGATSDTAGTHGLTPAPAAGAQGKYLRGDGTWQTPPNTTYTNMTAATASAAGKAGLVPAPSAGKQASYLRGDGTWVVPTNTTYSNFTGATASGAGKAGLVPAPTSGSTNKYLKSDGTWGTIEAAESATESDIDNIINGLFS